MNFKQLWASIFRAPKVNTSRRLFMRRAAGAAALVAMAPLVRTADLFTATPTPPLSVAEKELVIANALSSEEGRQALAMSMREPIRRSLEYQALGRKLFLVDELPQGALPRYGGSW